MEGVVLAIVCLAPWAFGAADPAFEAVLDGGVALLGAWAVQIVWQRRFCWTKCPVLLCLAAMFLLAALQVSPLPAQCA